MLPLAISYTRHRVLKSDKTYTIIEKINSYITHGG